MTQVQILSPRPILTVRRKFYVREQTPLTHTAWHGKRTSRDSSPREICRYLITVNRSDFQSEDVGSTPITCSICCRGGTGIRERLKHAFSLGSIPSGNTKCDCGGIGRRSGFKFRWEIPVRVRASPVAPSIYGGSKAVMRHPLKCELTSSLTAILTIKRYAMMIIAGSTPARRTTGTLTANLQALTFNQNTFVSRTPPKGAYSK